MQIHELNNFNGTPGATNFLAIDDGSDTSRISGEALLNPVNSRIDNLTANVLPDSVETILDWANVESASKTLTKNVSGFDYLDLYFKENTSGTERIVYAQRYPRAAFPAQVTIPVIRWGGGTDPKYLFFQDLMIAISGTTLTMSQLRIYTWDGKAADGASIEPGILVDQIRVDGVKISSNTNAELTDLRTAHDGTVYASARAAREADYDDLDREIAFWREDILEAYYQFRNEDVVSNGSFNTSGLTTGVPNRIRTDLIQIKTGEKIIIENGSFQHAVGMWDGEVSQSTIRRNDNSFITVTEEITALYDGYLVVTFRKSDNTNISPSDFNGSVKVGNSLVQKHEKEIEEIESSLDGLAEGYVLGAVVSNGSFNVSGLTTGVQNRIRTDLIPFKTGDKYIIENGSFEHAVGMWNGQPSMSTIKRNDGSFSAITEEITALYDGYLVIVFRKPDNTDTSPSDFDGVIKAYNTLTWDHEVEIAEIDSNLQDSTDGYAHGYVHGAVISNGSFNSSGLTTVETNRIRTDLIPVKLGDKIVIENGSFEHAIGIWDGAPSWSTLKRNDNSFSSITEEVTMPYDGFIVIVFRKSGNTNIAPSEFDGNIYLYNTIAYRDSIAISETPIVPSYYYSGNYLENKASRINTLGKQGDDVFVFITDIHWELNAKYSPALISYLGQNCAIHKVFNGGDVADASLLNVYKRYRKAIDGKTYHITGNHDWFYPTGAKDLYYCMDSANNNQIGNAFRHYWYTDNVQLKIRYVALNPFLREGEAQTLTVGYDADQIAWFTNEALNVPNDWDVIVFTHFLRLTTVSIYGGAEDIENAIDSFNSDSSHTGKVLAVFQGHTHWDGIYHTAGGVPVITTTCDKYDLSNEPELAQSERVLGTISEQAFDVVILNRDTKTFTCVRIGARAQNNIDKYRTDEGFEWVGTLEERIVSYE